MNYNVHDTTQFEKDLDRALDYIEFALQNPQAADNLLDEAEHTLNSLSRMPERYALVDDALLSAWGVRCVQVKHYLAFYVVEEESRTVHAIRFLYGRSDWRSILRSGYDTK